MARMAMIPKTLKSIEVAVSLKVSTQPQVTRRWAIPAPFMIVLDTRSTRFLLRDGWQFVGQFARGRSQGAVDSFGPHAFLLTKRRLAIGA